MKKANIFILLLILIVSLFGCGNGNNDKKEEEEEFDYSNTVDIIVLAGQSNMEGNSLNSFLLSKGNKDMQDLYLNGFENTQIMYCCARDKSNKSSSFESVKLGQGFNKNFFGPEIGIAEEWYLLERERPLYLVKYAVGGTSLYQDWNVINQGSLYHKMVMYVYDQILYFEEQGIRPIIRGLFWMQGEADSCNLNMTNNYAANLNRFVESFREQYEEEYGVPGKGIAFVDAGISDSSDWPYYELINQIKKDFADSNPSKNYYFGTIEENLEYHLEGKKSDGSTDTYHYDATSELELGKLFISTLIDAGWL